MPEHVLSSDVHRALDQTLICQIPLRYDGNGLYYIKLDNLSSQV